MFGKAKAATKKPTIASRELEETREDHTEGLTARGDEAREVEEEQMSKQEIKLTLTEHIEAKATKAKVLADISTSMTPKSSVQKKSNKKLSLFKKLRNSMRSPKTPKAPSNNKRKSKRRSLLSPRSRKEKEIVISEEAKEQKKMVLVELIKMQQKMEIAKANKKQALAQINMGAYKLKAVPGKVDLAELEDVGLFCGCIP